MTYPPSGEPNKPPTSDPFSPPGGYPLQPSPANDYSPPSLQDPSQPPVNPFAPPDSGYQQPTDPYQPLMPNPDYPPQSPVSGYPAPGPVSGYPMSGPGPVSGYPGQAPVSAPGWQGQPMPGQMGPMGPGQMVPMGPGGPMGPGQMVPMGPGGPMGPGPMGPMGPGGPMGPMGPGGVPPTQRSSSLPWIIGGIATVVVLCLIGVGVVFAAMDDNDPDPRPTRQATSGPSGQPSESQAGSADPGKSNFTSLGDICPKIDTAALGDWAATKEAANTSQNKTTYSEWSSCYLRVRSAAKEMSTLDVTAKVYNSPEDAKDTVDNARKYGASKTFDADIPGLGQEAFGKYEEQDMSGRIVTYEIETRTGNLALSVRLTKFNTPSTTKDQIKAKAIAQTKAALVSLSK